MNEIKMNQIPKGTANAKATTEQMTRRTTKERDIFFKNSKKMLGAQVLFRLTLNRNVLSVIFHYIRSVLVLASFIYCLIYEIYEHS